MKVNVVFSKRLRKLREEKGISQRNAAKSLCVSQAVMHTYEKGIREPGLDFVVRAAKFYRVSSDYLVGNSDIKSSSNEIGDVGADTLTEEEFKTLLGILAKLGLYP